MNDHTPFHRVAIINRGEPAVRFIRALCEYNLERETEIQSIALYTHEDEHAPFVHQATEGICIGEAMRVSQDGKMVSAYCDHEFMIQVLKDNRCDAIWPGWGFVSEDASFVEKVEQEGIVFIGPSSKAMKQLGDKIASKYMAKACGLPMAPWMEISDDQDSQTLFQQAQHIGYPLMVKASGGGGGRGIRKVNAEEELLTAIGQVREEVARVFGQGGIFMEACITDARHIEVQVVADSHGNSVSLGIRDCSIQRRNQKVIEEAPSPILPQEVDQHLRDVSAALVKYAGYVGVGTVEYLYQPESGLCSFLEVNSRLQVEHTITELVTDCDLVKAQLDIAYGNAFAPGDISVRGHAIELRLNAENPEKGFQPSPGTLRLLRFPSGPGLRIDSGVLEGMEISPHFDSMIAKIIVWAPTRKQAIARARRACQELDVIVQDGATNQAFLGSLLRHRKFIDGTATTAWLDHAMKEGSVGVIDKEYEGVLAAAVLEYLLQAQTIQQTFFSQVQDGIPQHISSPQGLEVDLRLRDQSWKMQVYEAEGGRWIIEIGDSVQILEFKILCSGIAQMMVNDVRHKILYSYGSTGIFVEVDGHTHPVERSSGGVVRAPSPSVVVSIAVKEGDIVSIGDRLCTLEAMKMEMGVFAKEEGRVQSIVCRPNQQVSIAQPLLILEAEGETGQQQDVQHIPEMNPRPFVQLFENDTVCVEKIETWSVQQRALLIEDILSLVKSVMLGFDVVEKQFLQAQMLFDSLTQCQQFGNPEQWKPLIQALEMFADCELLLDRNLFLAVEGAPSVPADLCFYEYCRRHAEGEDSLIPSYASLLHNALRWYGVKPTEIDDRLRTALWRLSVTQQQSERRHRLCSSVLRFVIQLHEVGFDGLADERLKKIIGLVAQTAKKDFPFLRDNAIQAQYALFHRPKYALRVKMIEKLLLESLLPCTGLPATDPKSRMQINELVRTPQALQQQLFQLFHTQKVSDHRVLETLVRRLYSGARCEWKEDLSIPNGKAIYCDISLTTSLQEGDMVAVATTSEHLLATVQQLASLPRADVLEIVLYNVEGDVETIIRDAILCISEQSSLPKRCTFNWRSEQEGERHRNYRVEKGRLVEDTLLRNIHPEAANRLELWRLQNFHLERLEAHDRVYAFRGTARNNAKDERIFICAEVFGESSQQGGPIWEYEQTFFEAVKTLREIQSQRSKRTRYRWNWMHFYIHPVINLQDKDIEQLANQLEPHLRGLSVREVTLRARIKSKGYAPPQNVEIVLQKPGGYRMEVERRYTPIPEQIAEMSSYDMRVVRSKKLKSMYPYELLQLLVGTDSGYDASSLHPAVGTGSFVEYDLDENNQFVSVNRPYGGNSCGVVCGILSHITPKYPQGMSRVWIASDATRAMGALAEPECRRIIACIDLAEKYGYPIEWIPISAGAKISMDSGTENLDWTALVLRRIVEFTQRGGVCNIIVHGINVGAQSYWNAEATMMMHTKGILIMTLEGSMVLTGKKALDFSGGVSAEDERGIGGVERIMGPNGQAQFVAQDLGDAYQILFEWYRYSYRKRKEEIPRRFPTTDSITRSVLSFPYRSEKEEQLRTIGDIFDQRINPDRKKPFAIREVMASVIDQDGGRLERFAGLQDGESAVVWDAHVGGWPVCLIGIESRQVGRRGRIPMDGPEVWTGGTLFPNSSRKVARALNGASGNRPVVVLANLSGFDGSPESLRRLQLEYGAEIGRAVVNFDGPIVFVVVGRYHGGAYVVFSKSLNPNLKALAVQGSFASVIGGAPAAAVVFPREVKKRVEKDARVRKAIAAVVDAPEADKPMLRETLDDIRAEVLLEKRGEVAKEFDEIHSVNRAVSMGSLDAVIEAKELRPRIVGELNQALIPEENRGHSEKERLKPFTKENTVESMA